MLSKFNDFIFTAPFIYILFLSHPNRPVLVLKCDQGFVGYKSATSTRLECNKATYETIVVERTDKGMVHLKGTNCIKVLSNFEAQVGHYRFGTYLNFLL